MKSVDEVDDQVRDLSRGGNAAIRGVLFANMYIQGRAQVISSVTCFLGF